MKKLLCVLFAAAVCAAFLSMTGPRSEAAEMRLIRLGLLTKLNTTEEEFSETWRKTFAPNHERLKVIVRFYDSLNAMQMALNAGDIHQIVLPEAVAYYLMRQSEGDYETTLTLRSKEPYGLSFGFREGEDALRDKFNDALRSLVENWKLAALEGLYIDSSSTRELQPVKFEKFEGAETLKVAVTGDLPPIDFIAADGTPAGFNTAVLAEVGNALQMNVELINVESGARTAALASGRADVVFWYEVDPSAKEQADVPNGVILSEPYYEWNRFLHIKKAELRESSPVWNVKRSIWDFFWKNP